MRRNVVAPACIYGLKIVGLLMALMIGCSAVNAETVRVAVAANFLGTLRAIRRVSCGRRAASPVTGEGRCRCAGQPHDLCAGTTSLPRHWICNPASLCSPRSRAWHHSGSVREGLRIVTRPKVQVPASFRGDRNSELTTMKTPRLLITCNTETVFASNNE